jgi:urease accessory protein
MQTLCQCFWCARFNAFTNLAPIVSQKGAENAPIWRFYNFAARYGCALASERTPNPQRMHSYNEYGMLELHPVAPEGDNTHHNDAIGWRAELQLRCERVGEKSLLTQRSHRGPLRLLKPLYPEGDAVCHAVIVHPPGGIVAGDVLDIEVAANKRGHLLVTTPGTQKWYRSIGREAAASTTVRVDASSALEWLPQETMLFDGAQISQRLTFRLEGAARFFGWEIVCLGRTSRNEQFTKGLFKQRIEIIRDDVIDWCEHTALRGGDALLTSPLGLANKPVMATAWVVYESDVAKDAMLIEKIRTQLVDHPAAAASNPSPGLIVIKVVDDQPETVRRLLTCVWSRIRHDVFSIAPHMPRIWST